MATEFDYYTAHQVYLEGYKDGLVAEHESMFEEIIAVLLVLIARTGVKHLGELSRSELNALSKKAVAEVVRLFDRQERKVMAGLKAFLAIDRALLLSIFGMTEADDPPAYRVKVDTLWEKAMGAPISGGVGLEPKAVFAASLSAMVAEIRRAIKAAYADRKTPAELTRALVGTKANKLKDGVITKMRRNFRTSVNTVVQHTSSYVMFEMASLVADRYTWCAVLDSRTTEICRNRNGHVYRFSDGPRPPAHWGCRSFIIPITSERLAAIPTFYSWINGQSSELQNDVLGLSRARRLRKGDLKSDELPGFDYTKPLTLSAYQTKLSEMLTKVA